MNAKQTISPFTVRINYCWHFNVKGSTAQLTAESFRRKLADNDFDDELFIFFFLSKQKCRPFAGSRFLNLKILLISLSHAKVNVESLGQKILQGLFGLDEMVINIFLFLNFIDLTMK